MPSVVADVSLLLLVQSSALGTGILALLYTHNDVFLAVKETWRAMA